MISRYIRVLEKRSDATHVQFVKFVVAAGASVPVNLASRVLFSMFVPFELAIIFSQLCGMLVAYTLTKQFVFASSGREVHSELLRFMLVNLVSLAQVWVVAVGLFRFVLPRLDITYHPEFVSQLVGLTTSAFTSFVGHRKLSFASK